MGGILPGLPNTTTNLGPLATKMELILPKEPPRDNLVTPHRSMTNNPRTNLSKSENIFVIIHLYMYVYLELNLFQAVYMETGHLIGVGLIFCLGCHYKMLPESSGRCMSNKIQFNKKKEKYFYMKNSSQMLEIVPQSNYKGS